MGYSDEVGHGGCREADADAGVGKGQQMLAKEVQNVEARAILEEEEDSRNVSERGSLNTESMVRVYVRLRLPVCFPTLSM